jgi:hypothetical protein
MGGTDRAGRHDEEDNAMNKKLKIRKIYIQIEKTWAERREPNEARN